MRTVALICVAAFIGYASSRPSSSSFILPGELPPSRNTRNDDFPTPWSSQKHTTPRPGSQDEDGHVPESEGISEDIQSMDQNEISPHDSTSEGTYKSTEGAGDDPFFKRGYVINWMGVQFRFPDGDDEEFHGFAEQLAEIRSSTKHDGGPPEPGPGQAATHVSLEREASPAAAEVSPDAGSPSPAAAEESPDAGSPSPAATEVSPDSGSPSPVRFNWTHVRSTCQEVQLQDFFGHCRDPMRQAFREARPSEAAEVSPDAGSPSTASAERSQDDGSPSPAAAEESPDSGSPSPAAAEVSPHAGSPSTASAERSQDAGSPSPAAAEESPDAGSPRPAAVEVSPDNGSHKPVLFNLPLVRPTCQEGLLQDHMGHCRDPMRQAFREASPAAVEVSPDSRSPSPAAAEESPDAGSPRPVRFNLTLVRPTCQEGLLQDSFGNCRVPMRQAFRESSPAVAEGSPHAGSPSPAAAEVSLDAGSPSPAAAEGSIDAGSTVFSGGARAEEADSVVGLPTCDGITVSAVHPVTGRCQELLSHSGCPPGQLFMLSAEGTEPACRPLPCPSYFELLVGSECLPYRYGSTATCAAGEELVRDERGGGGRCACRSSYVRWPEDGRCYPALTRGPCAEGRVLKPPLDSAEPSCEDNPCVEEGMWLLIKPPNFAGCFPLLRPEDGCETEMMLDLYGSGLSCNTTLELGGSVASFLFNLPKVMPCQKEGQLIDHTGRCRDSMQQAFRRWAAGLRSHSGA